MAERLLRPRASPRAGRDDAQLRSDHALVLLVLLAEDLLEEEPLAAVVRLAPALQGFLALVALELVQVGAPQIALFLGQRAVLDLVALDGPLLLDLRPVGR